MPEVYKAPATVSSQTGTTPEPKGEEVAAGEEQPVLTKTAAAKAETRRLVDEVLGRMGEKPRKDMGGAYMVSPGGRFINEQEDEEVVLLLRAHPITNVRWMLTVIGALVLPEILVAVGMFANVPFKFVFVGRLVWYLMILGFSFEKFLNWYYSVFIVTNERVVDIDFVNLLHRVVSYATLNHIEEPTMVAGGFIRSWFRYGDVSVATAAEFPAIEARAVPYPDKVIRVISELSEELEKRRERGE